LPNRKFSGEPTGNYRGATPLGVTRRALRAG
jgi:hypothetical protein